MAARLSLVLTDVILTVFPPFRWLKVTCRLSTRLLIFIIIFIITLLSCYLFSDVHRYCSNSSQGQLTCYIFFMSLALCVATLCLRGAQDRTNLLLLRQLVGILHKINR